MKTSYPYLLLLPLLIAGCSADDEPAVPSEGSSITFRVGDGSRGIDNVSDMNVFSVWGWATDDAARCTRIFNEQSVQRSGNLWTYTPKVYWMPDRAYRFLAVATNKTTGSGLAHSPALDFTSWEASDEMSFTAAAPFDEDILYATDERRTESIINSSQDLVEFNFRHLLTRLKLEVQVSTLDNHHIHLKSITFKPENIAGIFRPMVITTEHEIPPTSPKGQPTYITTSDVQVKIASTTPNENAVTHTLFSHDPDSPEALPDTEHFPYLYLIPGVPGTFTVEYDLVQNGIERYPLHSFTDHFRATQPLMGGRSYKATLRLPSPSSVISFEAILEPWGDDNDTDREILHI